ncbi:MAG: hypothetical protein K2I40_06300 [Bifidobacterium castoris]|nr:hypothetical protein [Bifidobacterium castoris]
MTMLPIGVMPYDHAKPAALGCRRVRIVWRASSPSSFAFAEGARLFSHDSQIMGWLFDR